MDGQLFISEGGPDGTDSTPRRQQPDAPPPLDAHDPTIVLLARSNKAIVAAFAWLPAQDVQCATRARRSGRYVRPLFV